MIATVKIASTATISTIFHMMFLFKSSSGAQARYAVTDSPETTPEIELRATLTLTFSAIFT
jgi:hypothetical protein